VSVPVVSIIIPCLNEEANIVRCLDGIGRQTYAHSAIEVFVADGGSTDGTHALIDDWNRAHDIRVEVVHNPRVVAEFGNAEALPRTRGDFIYLMGADEEMAQPDFLETFIEAFDVFPDIAGVEQDFLHIPGGNITNNYLAMIHINDPLARDIAGKPREVERVKRDGRVFRKFEFPPAYPAKLVFKREYIEDFVGRDTFEEAQVMLKLAHDGNNRLAMVDGYGVYHHNIKSLRQYLRNRVKIALKHTTRISERKTWVSYTGNKVYLFIPLHLTIVYPLLFSLYKVIATRRLLWLLHAPMAFISTAVYVCSWIVFKLTRKRAW